MYKQVPFVSLLLPSSMPVFGLLTVSVNTLIPCGAKSDPNYFLITWSNLTQFW